MLRTTPERSFSGPSPRCVGLASGTLVALFLPGVARATVVTSPPTVNVSLYSQISNAPNAPYLDGHDLNTIYAVVGARAEVSGGARPIIDMTAAGGPNLATGGTAELEYLFRVSAPPGSPSVDVPMAMDFQMTVEADGTSLNVAQAILHISGATVGTFYHDLFYLHISDSSVDHDGGVVDFETAHFPLLSNSSGTVVMNASLDTYLDGNATAYLDPFFYIDPTFLAANPGYSISVAPGVGNDPAPEPATLLLVTAGAMGTFLPRRRAKEKRHPAALSTHMTVTTFRTANVSECPAIFPKPKHRTGQFHHGSTPARVKVHNHPTRYAI